LKKILRICLKNQLVICTLPDLWDILLYSVDVVRDELLLLCRKYFLNPLHLLSKNECLEKCFMEYLLSDRKNVLLKLSIHLQNIFKN